MKSMLTPSAATSLATALNAPAVIGRPSTKMVWVDGCRMIGRSSLRSMATSRPTPWMAAATSSRSGTVGNVQRARHQHTQREPAPDHHLFDVEQLDSVLREHLEERGCHAWLIHAGDRDQHRHLGWHAHLQMGPNRYGPISSKSPWRARHDDARRGPRREGVPPYAGSAVRTRDARSGCEAAR